MSDKWKTCREAQVACGGCGKSDSCNVSPDGQTYKCWRRGGALVKTGEDSGHHFHRSGFTTLTQIADSFSKKLGPVAGAWPYHDAHGKAVMGVVRFAGADGKTYRPFHCTGGQWKPGDPEGLLPLYRLSEVMANKRVFVCEGEKAAGAARKLELVATTSAHGAASPRKTDWAPLSGKEVIILPDNDAPGMEYAQEVARILLSLPNPAKVMVIELPSLQQGDDLFDWVEYLKPMTTSEIRSLLEGYVHMGSWITLNDIPQRPVVMDEPAAGPVLTQLSQVKPEPIQWLWEGKLALGKLSGWAGAPGDGKSVASLDVAARVTTGAAWPDGGRNVAGSVLLVTAEDGLADTIRPRLDAHGANSDKVHHFSMIRRRSNGKELLELFNLSEVNQLEKSMKAIGDCRLVIIDPVGSFFGADTDANGDAAVRSVLAPISVLAEKFNCAVLLVMHTRKEGGDRADDAVMGSRAFTGIVRCMWHVRRDDDDPERRLFLPGKNNTAKALTGLAYRVVDCHGTAKVEWEDQPVKMTADEAVKRHQRPEAPPKVTVRQQIEQWLEEVLDDREMPAGNPESDAEQPGTLIALAEEKKFVWKSVQRTAKAMGVIHTRRKGITYWRLPEVLE